MAFYELRQYKVRPGKMAEWLKIMEEEIIPFQVAKGMVITGSYRGETDDSVYVWLRRFESEAQREGLYKAVYESEHWKKEIAPRIPDLLDREKMVVTRIVPTTRSTAQSGQTGRPKPRGAGPPGTSDFVHVDDAGQRLGGRPYARIDAEAAGQCQL